MSILKEIFLRPADKRPRFQQVLKGPIRKGNRDSMIRAYLPDDGGPGSGECESPVLRQPPPVTSTSFWSY